MAFSCSEQYLLSSVIVTLHKINKTDIYKAESVESRDKHGRKDTNCNLFYTSALISTTVSI